MNEEEGKIIEASASVNANGEDKAVRKLSTQPRMVIVVTVANDGILQVSAEGTTDHFETINVLRVAQDAVVDLIKREARIVEPAPDKIIPFHI